MVTLTEIMLKQSEIFQCPLFPYKFKEKRGGWRKVS
jgi:hypothetical protein